MNVCMLTYSFYESDTRVMQYATALAERGDTVDVLSLRRPGTPAFEVLDGVNVYRIQGRKVNEKGRGNYLGRIMRFLVRSGFVLSRRHLARPYQLIHVHSVPDFLVFGALFPKLLGARVILDIHDVLPELYASKFKSSPDSKVFKVLLQVEKISARFADHVIVANDIWMERVASRAVNPGKCSSITNYPDLRIFARQRTKVSNGKFLIIYPGSLNFHQGVQVALRAFAKTVSRIPNAEFHIYGEGPARPALMQLSQDLGLSDRVQFHAPVSARQIAQVMANADLAVEPKIGSSTFGNEAVSTKIMQFMALGVPVIASRTKIHDYYFNKSVVRFFDPENEAELAESIVNLYHDPAGRKTLSENASRYIERNNWEVKKGEYIDLVDRLTRQESETL